MRSQVDPFDLRPRPITRRLGGLLAGNEITGYRCPCGTIVPPKPAFPDRPVFCSTACGRDWEELVDFVKKWSKHPVSAEAIASVIVDRIQLYKQDTARGRGRSLIGRRAVSSRLKRFESAVKTLTDPDDAGEKAFKRLTIDGGVSTEDLEKLRSHIRSVLPPSAFRLAMETLKPRPRASAKRGRPIDPAPELLAYRVSAIWKNAARMKLGSHDLTSDPAGLLNPFPEFLEHVLVLAGCSMKGGKSAARLAAYWNTEPESPSFSDYWRSVR